MSQSQKLDVRYVAQLARLNLTDEEVATFQAQLEDVLKHIAELNSLDVSYVEPTAHAKPSFNIWREDGIRESFPVEIALKNAPARNNDLIAVPQVIE